jgi:hypothetical protein
MANGSNVCLLPSDVVERAPALREVLWNILGWDKDAVVAVERFTNALSNHVFMVTKRGDSPESYAGARGWSSGAVDRLLAEVDVCVRVSHLHWALWGVLEGARRQESAGWDYLGYAKGRYGRLLSGSTLYMLSM